MDLFDDRPVYPPEPPPTKPIDPPFGCPPEVTDLFEKLALKLSRDGWKKYSARAILHRIRWHFRIDRDLRDFKCNNNWTPKLARWVMSKHPGELENFFELRRSPNGKDEDEDE